MFDFGCASTSILSYNFLFFAFGVSTLSAEWGAGGSESSIWFSRSPEPIAAPLGDEVNFQCTLNIQPQEYRWKHGSELLPHNKSQDLLKVQFTNESQVGDYQCIAVFHSKSALASTAARLSLVELKPFPPQKEEYYEVTPGNTFTINCPPPVSNPAAIIHFFKNETELPANTPIQSTTGLLLLSNVTTKDAGTYSCSATNYITDETIQSGLKVNVKVIENKQLSPPKFLHEPRSTYVVQAGSNITVECTAVGEPVPKVAWKKIGSSLPDNRTEMVPGGLTLWDIVLEDAGEYSCEISNGVGLPLSRNILVQVQEPPRISKGPIQDTSSPEEGGELTLSCDVSGTPEPTVKWLLNSEPLDSDESIRIFGSMIKISNVGKRHAGIYQCFATNPVGSVYSATMVNVFPREVTATKSGSDREESSTRLPQNSGHGKRDRGRGKGHNKGRRNGKGGSRKKPHKDNMQEATRPNVTRFSDSSLMVRWSLPENNGLNVSFFKVQHINCTTTGGSCKQKTEKTWFTSSEIPSHVHTYEARDLLPNQNYKFRIAAVYTNNDNKLSLPSGWFRLSKNDSINKPPLKAPDLLSVEPASESSIRLRWQYFTMPENPIDGFYVFYRQSITAGDYTVVSVLGEDTRNFTITNLVGGSSYEFKMVAFTTLQASDFSSIKVKNTLKSIETTNEVDTSDDDKKISTDNPSPANPSSPLYLLIGVAVGGFGLLILICFLCCCFRKQSNSSSDEDGTESCSKIGDTALTIQQLEPVTMNGYGNHNGKMLNGRTPQRNGGFNCNHAMTITNNPLAESEQSKNVMELSYLSSQNNNCSAEGSSNP